MRLKNTQSSDNGQLMTETVDRELFIDIDNLNDELMDQPLLYKKYTRLKSKAFRNMNAIKDKLELLKASARLEFKNTQKKSTVADIDAMILADPRVQEVLNQYRDAEEEYEALEGVVYSFRQRHEALKELCANIRKEMGD